MTHAPEPVLVVLANVPDAESARSLARLLVESRLAACVKCLPAVRSTYRWQGEIGEATEIPLLIKTTAARYPDVEQAIRIAHSHEVPEIIAWPVEHGLPDYLAWVRAETAV